MDLQSFMPKWVASVIPRQTHVIENVEDRMRLAISLARMNIDRQTGGPFGAAVFNLATGELVGVGVNLTEFLQWSVAHAEVLAISMAEQKLGHYRLSGMPEVECELVTSTEPCAMCLGAICWAGVRRLVCGATEADARTIGFDEGPKPADWVALLEARGIEVQQQVCRGEAAHELLRYREKGGIIYNGLQGPVR